MGKRTRLVIGSRWLAATIYLGSLMACGGEDENKPPTANAGENREVSVGDSVKLDGTKSTDPEGAQLSFQWTLSAKPADSAAALDDPASATPAFTADKAGDYAIDLVVSDGENSSKASQVKITAKAAAQKPVAQAGGDRTVPMGTAVELDGSQSTAAAGELIYKWSIEAKPDQSQAALDDDTAAKPKFTADKEGQYTIKLIVNDGTADSDPATITITAVNKPVANAGADQQVTMGDEVALDGAASLAAPGLTLTYKWSIETKPDQSQAALDDDTAAKPKFTADKEGQYTIKLIVNDGTVDSDPASITITAKAGS